MTGICGPVLISCTHTCNAGLPEYLPAQADEHCSDFESYVDLHSSPSSLALAHSSYMTTQMSPLDNMYVRMETLREEDSEKEEEETKRALDEKERALEAARRLEENRWEAEQRRLVEEQKTRDEEQARAKLQVAEAQIAAEKARKAVVSI